VRRTLLGAAVAVLVAYLFICWRLGFAIEKQINEPLQQLKGKTPYVQVVANTYRRGWFVSEHDLTLGLFRNLPAAPTAASVFPAPVRITLHSVIWHGPICGLTCLGLARVRTHLIFGPALQADLSSAFGSAEPLRLESRMDFGGGGSAVLSSPAIKDTALADGVRIGWGGADLKIDFAHDYSSYSLHGSMPKVSYASADGNRIEADDIDLSARVKPALRTLFEGDSTLAIGRVSVSSAKAGGVVLSNLRGSYQSAANDGYMNMTYSTGVGAISAASLNFRDAHFEFSLKHLEMESFEQLRAAMQKVNQDSSLPPAQRGSRLLAALREPGIALLWHGPQFILDRVSISLGGGEAALSGTVALNGITDSDFGAEVDPKALIQKVNADLEFSIDDAFLNGLPNGAKMFAQLQAFAEQGLATHVSGKFHSKIAFRQGVTTFDGKSLPAPPPPPSSAPPARR
jgi:uncharacterized protein YdgA (DUF945 family)